MCVPTICAHHHPRSLRHAVHGAEPVALETYLGRAYLPGKTFGD